MLHKDFRAFLCNIPNECKTVQRILRHRTQNAAISGGDRGKKSAVGEKFTKSS